MRGDDVWGLLEPVGSMKTALRGYESTRQEFAGSIELCRSVMKLGKDNDCDINFCNTVSHQQFKTISMSHARVKPSKLEDTHKPSWGKNRFLAIWDDTSSNGTCINGTLVKKGTSKELYEGDRIKLGKENESLHFIFVRSLTLLPCVASVCVSLSLCGCRQHYPSHYFSAATPGASQRTEPLTDHSEPLLGKNTGAEEHDDEDSLFGKSDTQEDKQPASAALNSSAVRGQQNSGQANRNSAFAH
jgi:hypothetical protein